MTGTVEAGRRVSEFGGEKSGFLHVPSIKEEEEEETACVGRDESSYLGSRTGGWIAWTLIS